jgi:diguanylate cyclase (GGDEF)-like protein
MSLQGADATGFRNGSESEPAPLRMWPVGPGGRLNSAKLGLLACGTFLMGGLSWTAFTGLLTVSALNAYPLMLWGGVAAILLFFLGTTWWSSRQPHTPVKTAAITDDSNRPRISAYDSVTGLPTGRLFNFRLKQAWTRTRTLDRHIAVLVIELDELENISELQEQERRNLIYRIQAAKVKSAVRTTDFVARLADRTLAVLLNDIEPEDLFSVMRKLQLSLSLPFILDGQELFIASRIGVAQSTCDHDDETALLESAVFAEDQARARCLPFFGFERHAETSRTGSVPTIAA